MSDLFSAHLWRDIDWGEIRKDLYYFFILKQMWPNVRMRKSLVMNM